MRECSADLGPVFAGLTVAFVLLDGEDVEVRVAGAGSTRIRAWAWF